ncbi:hypothetical protein [uncultured Anaerovibrio sp.]|uniref:hypothetical protein n=1 Tax=uncultured Anaerovibrio sp. TaxID=361586 RepID=UPI002637D493|nr:hypothetical protein [uncultured Anaerovibrio sp.]
MNLEVKIYKRISGMILMISVICFFSLIGNERIVDAEESTILFEDMGSRQNILIDRNQAFIVKDARNTLKTKPQQNGAVKFTLSSDNLPVDLCIDIEPALVREYAGIDVREIKASNSRNPFYIFTFFDRNIWPKVSKVIGNFDSRGWKEIANSENVSVNADGVRIFLVSNKHLYYATGDKENPKIYKVGVEGGVAKYYDRYTPKINIVEQFQGFGKSANQLPDLECVGTVDGGQMKMYHLKNFSTFYDFSKFVPSQDCIQDVNFVIYKTTDVGLFCVQLEIKPEKYKEVLDYLTQNYDAGQYKVWKGSNSYTWTGDRISVQLSKYDSGVVKLVASQEHLFAN